MKNVISKIATNPVFYFTLTTILFYVFALNSFVGLNREAIFNGEIWRLLLYIFGSSNLTHLFTQILGFYFLYFLLKTGKEQKYILLTAVAFTVIVGVAITLTLAEGQLYIGFTGTGFMLFCVALRKDYLSYKVIFMVIPPVFTLLYLVTTKMDMSMLFSANDNSPTLVLIMGVTLFIYFLIESYLVNNRAGVNVIR